LTQPLERDQGTPLLEQYFVEKRPRYQTGCDERLPARHGPRREGLKVRTCASAQVRRCAGAL